MSAKNITTAPAAPAVESISLSIVTLRGQRVILDAELATLYEVPTKRFNEAVKRTMDEHGVSFSTANPFEVELAERLVEMIPSAERVVFSCTGSEATYHAIRLARGFTGRERILKFEGNYHGWHDYVAWRRRPG